MVTVMLEEGMLNIDTSRAKSGQTMNVRTFKILASDLFTGAGFKGFAQRFWLLNEQILVCESHYGCSWKRSFNFLPISPV